jgi:RNA polymerase-binding transcription factor DksA
VVKIAEKTISLRTNDSYLARILKKAYPKISEKDLISESKKIQKYLLCLTNERILKILYALSLAKVSTLTKLREYLLFQSRDTITYYSLSAMNAGFIEIKTNKDHDHEIIHGFWKGRVPQTHQNTRLYIATEELLNVMPLFESEARKLVDEKTIKKLINEGKAYDKYIKKKKAELVEIEKESERIAKNTFGACNRCSKYLSKEHLKTKKCQYVGDKIYCKDCVNEMWRDGTMSRLLKEKNGKQ